MKRLSEPSRQLWIRQLRAAYVDNATALLALKSTDVIALSKALELLGDTNSKQVFIQWLGSRNSE